MKYLNEKADRLHTKYILANLNKITVQPGKCRYNFRCHNNAVHDAIENKQSKLAMAIYLDASAPSPIIHFLNWDGKKYTDNTLGHWATQHEYFFVKWIEEEDFYEVGRIFTVYRSYLRKQLPWWVRLFSDTTC